MLLSDLSETDFEANINVLQRIMGSTCDDQPRSVYDVGPTFDKRISIPTMQGKFVSAALCRYLWPLLDGSRITQDLAQLAQAFFRPILDRDGPEKHQAAAALSVPGNLIWNPVDGTGMPGRLEDFWERRERLSQEDTFHCRNEVKRLFTLLEYGAERAAEPDAGQWRVRTHVKKGILLYFRTHQNRLMQEHTICWDKVPLLWDAWGANKTREFDRRGFRVVPPGTVRAGAYIAPNVIVMPGYVNVGAFVGRGTMVDTWATVGSCAQIGKNVHISGGAGIGGVLEPIQASPTIVEDDVFIGARSEVAEGVIVRKGAVLSMGVFIGRNTPIVDRVSTTFDAHHPILRGEVPARAVVMMGVHPENGLICPQIVKYRDEKTDVATALNEILRS